MNHSIGIIGGADGPTAVFVSGSPGAPVLGIFFAAVLLLALLVLFSRRGGKRLAVCAVGAAVILAADQAVKALTALTLAQGETAQLLPPLVRLHRVHNYGAAWSSFSGARWLLVGVTAAGLCFLAWLLIRYVRHALGVWSLSCVIAGGAGNLIDRLARGYVVDMLEFMFFDFPVFNVADIFITCGCAAALLYYLKFYDKYDAGRKHGTDRPASGKRRE